MYRGPFKRNSFMNKNKQQNKFKQEHQEWVVCKSESYGTKKNVKLTKENFPLLVEPLKDSVSNIKYDLKHLFKKTNKKKKKQLEPGWVKLYYKNNVPCRVYGPPSYCSYDVESIFKEIHLEKMFERHAIYEEQYEWNQYIPYWKVENSIPEEELDYYPGDTDSEEEYYEYEDYSDEEEDSDYY